MQGKQGRRHVVTQLSRPWEGHNLGFYDFTLGHKSRRSPGSLLLWGRSPGILYVKIKYHYLGEEVSSGECGFDVGLERQWRTCAEEGHLPWALEVMNFSPGPPWDLGTSLIYFLYIWKVC